MASAAGDILERYNSLEPGQEGYDSATVTCGICHGTYPIDIAGSIECGHTFCHICLIRLLRTDSDPSTVKLCPMCRSPVKGLPGTGLGKTLPDLQKYIKCFGCGNMHIPVEEGRFCNGCVVSVCRKCAAKKHRDEGCQIARYTHEGALQNYLQFCDWYAAHQQHKLGEQTETLRELKKFFCSEDFQDFLFRKLKEMLRQVTEEQFAQKEEQHARLVVGAQAACENMAKTMHEMFGSFCTGGEQGKRSINVELPDSPTFYQMAELKRKTSDALFRNAVPLANPGMLVVDCFREDTFGLWTALEFFDPRGKPKSRLFEEVAKSIVSKLQFNYESFVQITVLKQHFLNRIKDWGEDEQTETEVEKATRSSHGDASGVENSSSNNASNLSNQNQGSSSVISSGISEDNQSEIEAESTSNNGSEISLLSYERDEDAYGNFGIFEVNPAPVLLQLTGGCYHSSSGRVVFSGAGQRLFFCDPETGEFERIDRTDRLSWRSKTWVNFGQLASNSRYFFVSVLPDERDTQECREFLVLDSRTLKLIAAVNLPSKFVNPVNRVQADETYVYILTFKALFRVLVADLVATGSVFGNVPQVFPQEKVQTVLSVKSGGRFRDFALFPSKNWVLVTENPCQAEISRRDMFYDVFDPENNFSNFPKLHYVDIDSRRILRTEEKLFCRGEELRRAQFHDKLIIALDPTGTTLFLTDRRKDNRQIYAFDVETLKPVGLAEDYIHGLESSQLIVSETALFLLQVTRHRDSESIIIRFGMNFLEKRDDVGQRHRQLSGPEENVSCGRQPASLSA